MTDDTYNDLADAAAAAGWEFDLDAIAPGTGGTKGGCFRLWARDAADGHVLADSEWRGSTHKAAVALATRLLGHAEAAVRKVVADVRLVP